MAFRMGSLQYLPLRKEIPTLQLIRGSVEETTTTNENPNKSQGWTGKGRSDHVLSLLQGEISSQEAARQQVVAVVEREHWKAPFLERVENVLRSRPKVEDAFKDEQLEKGRQ